MKATHLLAAALLLTTTLAILPSAAAADIDVPPPCGPTALCTGPSCGEREVGTATAFAVLGEVLDLGMVYVGPHGGVRLNEDCSVTVWETGLDCQSHLLPLTGSQVQHDAGAVQAAIDACTVGFICACMPADLGLASASLPPPCYTLTTPCCGGPGFAPCPPPCDECPPPGPCREFAVATSQLLAYLGPHAGAALHSDCTADVWEAGLVCPKALPDEGHTDREVGPVGVHADTCDPQLVCTCDPLLAPATTTSASIEPPIEVEFVDCVTAPCPPIVRCGEREAHVPFVTDAYVERDCDVVVGLVDAYRICPGLHQQLRPSAGPVTLVVNYCAPALDCTCDPMPELLDLSSASSDSLQPPIYCVMAPCGPQCIVPCVPQVVPSDCELRQATPDRVGPLLIPANPRTLVWGSDPSDCTVDVDPAYECVGGWGFDRHVTAGFVDAVVRVCTAGPFPPPILQDALDAIQVQ
jgi:hypothetical protein